MSARRQARAGVTLAEVRDDGTLPDSLAVGPVVEIWCDPKLVRQPASAGLPIPVISSTSLRFDESRAAWLRRNDISEQDGWKLIPAGTAVLARTSHRLLAAGFSPADTPALADQADNLFAIALGDGALTRSVRRRSTGA